jgi:hypothetical protein
MADDYRRITAALIPAAASALDTACIVEGLPGVDIVNRALQLYAFVVQAHQDGNELLVRRPDGYAAIVDIDFTDAMGTHDA